MSRLYGLLGGIITTSSIAYLTAQEFKSNGNRISNHLNESRSIIDNHGIPKQRGPIIIEYESRDNIFETMKDLWNHEIIRGVNWFYSLGSVKRN